MKEYKIEDLEEINILGNKDYYFHFMQVPNKELYIIFVNGRQFAACNNYKDALILHDMLFNNFNDYLHIYEAQEGET